MQSYQMSSSNSRDERGRSKSEVASDRAANRKHNFLRMINKKRSKDTPLRPKPKLRFPKLAWKEGTNYGDPSDCYPPLGRLEPSLATGSKEWNVIYLGSIPNCSEWKSYNTRSDFLEHVDWGKRHGYLMCRSTTQKILMLSGTWLQVTDRRKKLLYVLNGIPQISSISCCEDSVEEDELLLGIKCLHPLGSMVQCHVLIVHSKKCMAEICDELQICFESLTRDREKMTSEVQRVSESLARLQHLQGAKALTVRQTTHGAMEGVDIESRHAMSEQPRLRTDTIGLIGQKEDSRRESIASSSEIGSLQPPVQVRKFEIHELEDSAQTGTQVPKRLQSLVQVNNTQTKDVTNPLVNNMSPGSDSYKAAVDHIAPSPPPEFTAPVDQDKPVARRIKKLINRLDLPDEHRTSDVIKPPPPPPKKIWEDGEDDDMPPVVRRPRRRQLDDPVEDRPVFIPPPVQQEVISADPVVKEPPLTQIPVTVTQSSTLADTEKALLEQQLELDIALRELQALNLGIDLPITHVDDVIVSTKDSNPITSVDKKQSKPVKSKFTGLRSLIPPPPPDIPPELRDTELTYQSSVDSIDNDVEIPEQISAQELRKRFDPNPNQKQALFSEIKKGWNLRKVSGDHPDQRTKQEQVDFRTVLTEIKQGGSKQRLRKVSQASQNRLAQSQKGRAVGELGAKLAERRLATEPVEQKPVDPAVYRAQRERHASRFARVQTGINPQTDLDADPVEYLPPWKRQLIQSREDKRIAAVREKEERERLKEEQMKDIPLWKRKLIEKKLASREQDEKKLAKEDARLDARIRKFENMPEWKKQVLRKKGKVDVIETSDSETESD